MVKIILVLLYLWKGQVTLEQKAYKDVDSCIEAGRARVAVLQEDPRFDTGLYANCIPLEDTSK